jgi:hypothetical protein
VSRARKLGGHVPGLLSGNPDRSFEPTSKIAVWLAVYATGTPIAPGLRHRADPGLRRLGGDGGGERTGLDGQCDVCDYPGFRSWRTAWTRK